MKISFLSLTATLAATVPYLTSAALLDFFVPESSAAASTKSLPDYSKVLKKSSKKRKVQTLKLSIPSPSSKNEEEEEGGDFANRDLEWYMPSDCVHETIRISGRGDFGDLAQQLYDFLNDEIEANIPDYCHLTFNTDACVIDSTSTGVVEGLFAGYCTEGTVHSYGLENVCVDENNFTTYTLYGLPLCLSNECNDFSDFIENVNITYFIENSQYNLFDDLKEGDEDGCVSRYSYTNITEWEDTFMEDKFYCDGEDESLFFYEIKDGEPVLKKCGWLDQFPMELKYIQCSTESPFEYPSAYDACPKACCTCKEHPEDRFFVKMTQKENNNGKLKAKTAECSLIDDIDNPFFKHELCHRESQKPNMFGNGNTVCPQSCGTCPSYEMFMDDGEDEYDYDD